jgi:hypothetical protein
MKKLLTNLLCVWICCGLVILPTTAYGDETPSSAPAPTPLKVNDIAPFNGVLIPTLEAAEMVARLEQQDAICQARVEAETATAVNLVNLRLNNCTTSRTAMDDLYRVQLTSQREYIDFLEKKAMGPKIPAEWVLVIGIVTGVGLTIGAGYAMHQVAGQ